MADAKETLVQRVQESYRQLSVVAASLNNASDKLGASITNLEVALKRLSLGITSWVVFLCGGSDDGFHYWSNEIGYAKTGGKWGLAIRSVSGNLGEPSDDIELWSFNDAPRHLRIQAVEMIPDLLDSLVKEAAEIVDTVDKQVETVDLLTAAITDEESW